MLGNTRNTRNLLYEVWILAKPADANVDPQKALFKGK